MIIWDGGNNDLPFIRPDLLLVVVDPLRAGDELNYHPGEVNLRMADVVIVNKVDSATGDQVRRVLEDIALANPDAAVIEAASPVSLAEGPSLAGKTVLVVEDGPSITHGGMSFGAGTVAAAQAGVGTQIDPRPFAVGSTRRHTVASRTSGRSCPRWGTHMSSCTSSSGRSTRLTATQ